MNIFVVDENPGLAARSLCDKHVVKMLVETAQILSTVLYFRGTYHKELYKPTHINHPCVVWASETQGNFAWTLEHGFGLFNSYRARYYKEHKTLNVLLVASKLGRIAGTTWLEHTKFVQCMPEKYRGPDAVEAYRRFYKGEKARFAKWKLNNSPSWWNDGKYDVMVANDQANLEEHRMEET